ncbi:MAG: hypothetical protein EOM50_18825 [Erysipelotrichia bacterium]|nr:hypothetical protein [Erysipelotrichia bacterium]
MNSKDVKKAMKHYFFKRKTTPKYECIDKLACKWAISPLESFSILMLHRAFFRYGSPISLHKFCKSLHIKKHCFMTQLRFMLYLRFAVKHGIIKKEMPVSMKISKIRYFVMT